MQSTYRAVNQALQSPPYVKLVEIEASALLPDTSVELIDPVAFTEQQAPLLLRLLQEYSSSSARITPDQYFAVSARQVIKLKEHTLVLRRVQNKKYYTDGFEEDFFEVIKPSSGQSQYTLEGLIRVDNGEIVLFNSPSVIFYLDPTRLSKEESYLLGSLLAESRKQSIYFQCGGLDSSGKIWVAQPLLSRSCASNPLDIRWEVLGNFIQRGGSAPIYDIAGTLVPESDGGVKFKTSPSRVVKVVINRPVFAEKEANLTKLPPHAHAKSIVNVLFKENAEKEIHSFLIMHHLGREELFDRLLHQEQYVESFYNLLNHHVASVLEGDAKTIGASEQALRDHLKTPLHTTDDWLQLARATLKAVKEQVYDVGLVHADLKPDNLLIHKNSIQVCDYGHARRQEEIDTREVGTEGYVAPEVSDGLLPTQASDIYSLGVILQYFGFNKFHDLSPWHAERLFKLIEQMRSYAADCRPTIIAALDEIDRIIVERYVEKIEDEVVKINALTAFNAALQLRNQLSDFKTKHLVIDPEKIRLMQQLVEESLQSITDEPRAIEIFLQFLDIDVFLGLKNKADILQKMNFLFELFIQQRLDLLSLSDPILKAGSHIKQFTTALNKNRQPVTWDNVKLVCHKFFKYKQKLSQQVFTQNPNLIPKMP